VFYNFSCAVCLRSQILNLFTLLFLSCTTLFCPDNGFLYPRGSGGYVPNFAVKCAVKLGSLQVFVFHDVAPSLLLSK